MARSTRTNENRKGVATVELAVCLPLFLSITFGFINCGLMVQLKTNSKLIGHMAATELHQAEKNDSATIAAIKSKHEQIAHGLGLRGLTLQISGDSSSTFTVRSSVSYQQNVVAMPINFGADQITTETFVFAKKD